MTNGELYIIELNIAHYQAMPKRDVDDERHLEVKQLRVEAERVLGGGFEKQQ